MKNTQLTSCLMVKDWIYHNLRLKARQRYLLPSLIFDNTLEGLSGQLGRKSNTIQTGKDGTQLSPFTMAWYFLTEILIKTHKLDLLSFSTLLAMVEDKYEKLNFYTLAIKNKKWN